MVDANEPRPPAIVIAARQADGGVELPLSRRGQAHRFLPGYLVFPGGAADPEDVGLAERWFGSPGDAARACAVRELLEEAGLALTVEGLIEVAVGKDLSAIDAAPPRRGGPTLKSMEALAAYRTVEEVLALRILQEDQ